MPLSYLAIDLDFATLDREVAQVFRSIQKAIQRQQGEASTPMAADPTERTDQKP